MNLLRYAEADLPTAYGSFRLYVYRLGGAVDEHMAIVKGDVAGSAAVLCRVHSECWTSEVLGSLKCDCRDQLDGALAKIAAEGTGVVVYLRQEGRGIGLGNKIRAYNLQDKGADTVEANLRLGFEADARSYDLAAAILGDLGVRSVRLLTNNPLKVAGLEASGVKVVDRLAHWVGENQHNAGYLAVKRRKMGHHPDVPVKLRSLPGVRSK
ncbi:MAG: GTP cyclohydrolase II [Deltaproteobacteria bacterium]|nr:GTP cyclohydrolase II [Deltaproteobacteria bacterium]